MKAMSRYKIGNVGRKMRRSKAMDEFKGQIKAFALDAGVQCNAMAASGDM